MKKDLERVVEIPEGVEVVVNGKSILVKGNGKELKRDFFVHNISLDVNEGKLVISAKKATKRESRMIGTIEAHVRNMIRGLENDFVYELEIASVHFPMTVKVEENNVSIKSFLGEKRDRFAKILDNVKVDIKGSKIDVSSHDLEAAGQTATNIEKAARLTGRDRRIFQDGIFITKKPERETHEQQEE